MTMLRFLAGVATGYLLHDYLARAHPRQTDGDADRPMNWMHRTDQQVRERITSQLGRTISNPDAVQVEVSRGCVTLRGSVHGRDAVLLMTEVENTAGVRSVRNELQIAGDLPAVRTGERATSQVA
jgi:osmotically-inducible protein OsmY